jgi:hypothetical protein
MGSSQSSTAISQTYLNENLLNQNDLTSIQAMTTNNIMNVVNNSQQSCAQMGGFAQQNNMNFNNFSGDFDYNGNTMQDINAIFNLSCVKKNLTENVMASSISQSIQQEIADKLSAEQQANIAARAQTASSQGFLNTSFLDPPHSNSVTNTHLNISTQNIVNNTLANIINNTIEQNFNNSDFQSCVNRLQTLQEADVTVDGGTGKIKINRNVTQEIKSEFEQDCVQRSKTINNVINQVAGNLNTVTRVTQEAAARAAATSDASATTDSKGIGSVFEDIGKALSSAIWVWVVIAVVIIVVIIVVMKTASSSPAVTQATQAVLAAKVPPV